MTHEEAVAKVTKLLRLAQSSNEHEAALAAQRAQEIMSKFKIDSLMLDDNKTDAESDNEPIVDFGRDVLYQGAHARATYRVRLAAHIAECNQVKLYLIPTGIAMVGRPSDCTTVRYLYGYFHREVIRLCNAKCKGHSNAYQNAWKNGCVATIGERLQKAMNNVFAAARQEATGNGLALMRVEHALVRLEQRQKRVDDFYAEMTRSWKTKAKAWREYQGREAYHRGRRDGHDVRMTSSKGSLTSGAEQIGGGK